MPVNSVNFSANLKKILNLLDDDPDQEDVDIVMEKLSPLITAANIAVDECDFGNSIELGIDLFCHGAPALHSTLLRLLVNGYTMINRPQFIAIVKVSFGIVGFKIDSEFLNFDF